MGSDDHEPATEAVSAAPSSPLSSRMGTVTSDSGADASEDVSSDAGTVTSDGASAVSSDAFMQVLAGAPSVDPEQLDLTGKKLGHFEVVEPLGRGGMGVVYRARDETLRREVALKVLPHEAVGSTERRRRFLREARAAAAMTHPNLATVFEVGEDEGQIFIAMELIEGQTLREVLNEGPLAVDEVLRLARGILAGVRKAHRAGIVHRDLKPDNVMCTAEGEVKVLDFGLAKVARETTKAPDDESVVTEEGRIMGTPGYMSPEQARGHAVDARTDVFALGAVLYEMICGTRAFVGDSSLDVIIATSRDEPAKPSTLREDVGAPYDELVARCLAKDPAERYGDAAQVLDALEACADNDREAAAKPGSAPATSWNKGVVFAAVALAVAAGGYVITRGPNSAAAPSADPVVTAAPPPAAPSQGLSASAATAEPPPTASQAPPPSPTAQAPPVGRPPAPPSTVRPPSPKPTTTPSSKPKVDLGI